MSPLQRAPGSADCSENAEDLVKWCHYRATMYFIGVTVIAPILWFFCLDETYAGESQYPNFALTIDILNVIISLLYILVLCMVYIYVYLHYKKQYIEVQLLPSIVEKSIINILEGNMITVNEYNLNKFRDVSKIFRRYNKFKIIIIDNKHLLEIYSYNSVEKPSRWDFITKVYFGRGKNSNKKEYITICKLIEDAINDCITTSTLHTTGAPGEVLMGAR